VVGEVSKLVRFDPEFLHALVCVGRMVQMHGPGGTLDPVFT